MNTSDALLTMAPVGSLLEALMASAPPGALASLEGRLAREEGPFPLGALCADLFAAGGKRLRALVTLSLSEAMGVPEEEALAMAESIELTHGATLLHDDVIDEADTRRSRPAARRRFSNTLSVLGGDYLLLRSLATVERLGKPSLNQAHRRAVDALLGAEVAQHLSSHQGDISTETYLGIARGKTGALFGFSCGAPALHAGNARLFEALSGWGEHFGVAFQVLDDLRDLFCDDPTKPGGLDLASGVWSLPLRLAAQGDPSLARELAVARAGDPSHGQGLLQRVRASTAPGEAARMGLAELARGREALREGAEMDWPGLGGQGRGGLLSGSHMLHQLHQWLENELGGYLPRCHQHESAR